MRAYPCASLPAGRDANQRRQVRRAAGLPSWRDANPRRQVPGERAGGLPARRNAKSRGQVRAGRPSGLSIRRDEKPRGQVPAERAGGMSARRDANPKRQVRADCAGFLSAGLRARLPRRVRADAAIRMSAGPIPQSLRRLRSLQGISRIFPLGRTGRGCAATRHVRTGARGRDVTPMTFINGGRSMKLAILFGGAIIAGSAALAPHAVRAQDQRAETEAIVRDYLANTPMRSAKSSRAISSSIRKRSARSWRNSSSGVRALRLAPAADRFPIAARPSPPTHPSSSIRPTR